MMNKLLIKYRTMSLPAKAGIWFTICSIVQRGIAVLSMPIFTRMLTTDQFGTYNLYTSWCMFFSFVVTLNLAAEVFNKGLTDHEIERPSYTTSQSALITVLTVISYLLYLAFHTLINNLTGMDTLLTSLMFLDIYTTTIVSLWFARKRFDYAYKPLFMVVLGISLVSTVVGIFAVHYASDSFKVAARVASNIFPSFIATICILFSFLKHSKKIFCAKWWKQSIRMGIPLVPHYASQVLLNQSDKLIIGWFLDMTSVAIYGVAHSAGLLLVMINNGVNSSLVPWLYGKLKKGDYQPISKIVNGLAIGIFLLVFCLMLLAPECISILATKDYRDAIWCIPPIATGVVFSFIYTLFVNVEIYYGKAGYVATASVISAVLNIALNLLLIPKFGYIASAWITSICYLMTVIFHCFFMKRALAQKGITNKIYNFRALFAICGVTIICALLSLLLYKSGPIRYILICLLILCVFIFRKKILVILKTVRAKENN